MIASFVRMPSTWLSKLLVLAATYVIFGRLALLLAIPPGYAMAVYPPAGIALGFVLIGGYRLAPGVALGSFLLNSWIGWETQGALTLAGCELPLVIAIGAMLQAFFGAWLVRRFVGYPTALDNEWDIIRFLLLSGPVGCLLNASVGVAALFFFGLLTPSDVTTNWTTWWIGDTLGVLIVTPIMLILWGDPQAIWRSRRWSVAVPLLASLVIVVIAFLFARQSEQARLIKDFNQEATRVAQTLQVRLNFNAEMVKSMERLFASSEHVSRKDFHTFVTPTLARYPTLHAVEWAPIVTRAERENFENAVQRDAYPNYAITELDQHEQKIPAGRRDDYLPVDYLEPHAGNESVLGFDLGSDATRRKAIEEARDTGRTIASEPLRLIQSNNAGHQAGGLLFTAVYRQDSPVGTIEERRRAFRGVVLSVVRMGDLIEQLFAQEQRRQIRFHLFDKGAPTERSTVYNTLDRPAQKIFMRTAITFGGRNFEFFAQPSNDYWRAHRSWAAWSALVGGLFFTSLVGMYLLVVSGNTFAVENLVAQRTQELQRSRVKLMESALLLQTVMDSTSSLVHVRDLDGRFLYVNKEYERVFNLTREQLIGKTLADVFPPDQARIYGESEQTVISTRTARRTEAIVEQDDGPHTYLVVRSPLINDQGEVLGACGVGTDITLRKRVEEAQHENLMLLQAVMDSTASAVCVRDIDGRYLFANKEYERLFNVGGQGEFAGKTLVDIFPPDVAQHYLEAGRQVVESGLATREEIAIHTNDGELIHLLVRSPLHNEKGEIYGMCAVGTDISQRKRFEEVMTALNRQLATTTRLQNAILNSANFSIIATDTEGVIQVFNVGAQIMLGYTSEEMLGLQTPVILHDPDEIVARARALGIELGHFVKPGFEVFVANARGGMPDEHEWTYIRKDGSRLPVMLSVTALWDENHVITGFLGIAYDVTERKKVESMKNEFISTVSHELRTPLTSIRGSLGLLVAGVVGEMPAHAKTLLEIAVSNCERLVRMINDILDVEKIESGNMKFDMVVQRLLPLVEQAIAATESYAVQHHVEFELVKDEADGYVAVDADRIAQVLTNLLANASKFSPAGGVVTVRLVHLPGRVRLSVIDKGLGIPTEFHDRIFQKFAQADSSDTRKKGGTGLGLSISKAIIEHHRGRIGFRSESGVGTEFFFELPLVTAEGNAPDRTGNVLICEDDLDIANLLGIILAQDGLSSDIAYNAEQARVLLATGDYQAMTLDLALRGEDGLSLLQWIRMQKKTRRLPVVVVSAHVDDSRFEVDPALDVADWIAKPIQEDDLLDAVRNAIWQYKKAKPRILHVASDRDIFTMVSDALAPEFLVKQAANLVNARDKLADEQYNLIIIDPNLPDGDGVDLLLSMPELNGATPVVIFSEREPDREVIGAVAACLTISRTSEDQLLAVTRQLAG